MIDLRNKKILSVLMTAIWVIQLLVELIAFGIVWQLNMLPGKYMLIMAVVLGVLWLLTGGLLFLGKKKAGNGRRIVAMILAVLIVLGCAGASDAVSQLSRTMNSVTGNKEITTMMAVYVRVDDGAQQIQNASGYTFAVLENIGADKTAKALDSLQNLLGVRVATVGYPSVMDLAYALYSGEVDAILMSSAYTGILEELDGYGDFGEKTRVLYEISLVDKVDTGSSGEKDPLTTRPQVGENKGDNESDKDTPVEVASITNTPFVVYLSGSDTRSTTLVTSRSDVNILAVVNPETKQVLLVNTPRDYYIPHPYAPEGQRDKLTHLGNDGIACSIAGLENLYNERVDFYAQINFTGFETLIDAIGGITVYFERSFSAFGILPIYEGDNYLTGAQALMVARDRYSFSDGDNARGRNQMKIIKAVIQKLASGAIISNYADILASLQGMFVTDIGMNDISELVKMQLNDLASWNVQTYAVTGVNGEDRTYTGGNASVMYVDQGMVDYATELIDRVIAGDILTDQDAIYPGWR